MAVTFLWTPLDYQGGLQRIRRNPQASLYQPVLEPDDWGYDNTITPNGIATLGDAIAAASQVGSALDKAGTRGAAALGAVAGFLLSTNRLLGAAIGGTLGYFGGKYIVSFANKALAVGAAVNTVETKTEKATS
jgi:hypothetical protein